MKTYKEILAVKHDLVLAQWNMELTCEIISSEDNIVFPLELEIDKDYWLKFKDELKLCLEDKGWLVVNVKIEDDDDVAVVEVITKGI